MKFGYSHTRAASYAGIVTQSLYLGLIPVLFAAFKNEFGLTYEQLGRIPLVNFTLQIILDLIMVKFGDRFRLRALAIVSNSLGVIGLVLLSVLPRVMTGAPYAALMISTVFLAIGCGLIDLAINPIINALPAAKKRAELPLLHSFFCFGSVFTFLTSTLFVHFAGTEKWYLLPLVMAVIPALDLIAFIFVPIIDNNRKSAKAGVKKKFISLLFILLMLMMICAGSAEQAVSSWISLFAELGLFALYGDRAYVLRAFRREARYEKNSARFGFFVRSIVSRNYAYTEQYRIARLLRADRLFGRGHVARGTVYRIG